jgi:septation ring formation regulator EzrA
VPTTEERLTDLETQMSEVQAVVQTLVTASQVYQIVESMETSIETNDTEHNSYEQRLSLLERATAQFRGLLSGLNADGTIVKTNYAATTAPGVGDDIEDGYSVGSRWINISADDEYVALDVTAGAAVWKKTTP